MNAYIEERRSAASWWCRRIATFAFFLALVAIAAHWLGFLETRAFFNVLALVFGLCLFALHLAVSAFQRVWYRGDRGGADLVVGVLVAALVLAPFSVASYFAATRPALVDISTDTDDPPAMMRLADARPSDANPLIRPGPEAAAIQTDAYPSITGRRYSAAAEPTTGAIEALMEEWGWDVVSGAPAANSVESVIEAVARLPVLAIPYDVAVRVTDEGDDSYVDMRSSARYGSRDLGVNAYLIESFLTELDKRVAALAGITPLPQ